MRNLALAVLLSCMLSGTVRAGEIPSTGVTTPPPPPSTATTAGEVPSTGATAPQASSTLVTLILTLLRIGR